MLGAGGMGVVCRAELLEPVRQPVAVKVLWCEAASAADIAGFEVERPASARFGHRNVTIVLDAGVAAGGRPYLLMELSAGPMIGHYAAEEQLRLRDHLLLFAAVCRGVHHAYQRGWSIGT